LDVFEAYARQEPPGVVFKAGESELTADQFNEVTAPDVTNLRTRLTQAKDFALQIAGKFHPKTFLLFGDGLPTVTKVDFSKGKATPDGADMDKVVNPRPPAGDGTVPRASAKFEACSPIPESLPTSSTANASQSLAFAPRRSTESNASWLCLPERHDPRRAHSRFVHAQVAGSDRARADTDRYRAVPGHDAALGERFWFRQGRVAVAVARPAP
jgi:hypothetical protein